MTKKVDDELELIWKEGHNSYIKYQPGICFKGQNLLYNSELTFYRGKPKMRDRSATCLTETFGASFLLRLFNH